MNGQLEQPEQRRQWIRDLVTAYADRLVEKRRAEEKRVREEQQMRQQQANRLTPEIVGEKLWDSLRETLTFAAIQFNELYGASVMDISEVPRGSQVEIRLESGSSKLSTVGYFRDPATLRWQMDGGSENSLGVGLNPETDRKSTRLNSSHRCISYAV